MTRLLPMMALMIAFAPALHAEEVPVLAEYWTDSGSLPPEYAWETKVTIRADGTLRLKHCKGYETEGPACRNRKAKVAAPELEAILAAARASELAETPAREADSPLVGGSMTGGMVWLEGERIELLSDPDPADAARIAPVLAAIETAIPARFDRFLTD